MPSRTTAKLSWLWYTIAPGGEAGIGGGAGDGGDGSGGEGKGGGGEGAGGGGEGGGGEGGDGGTLGSAV